MRILDIGSGTGDLAADIHGAFPSAELLGLDVSEAAVEHAARKVPTATFLQRDLIREAGADPKHTGWATHAVCSEVLEHVEDPGRLLANTRPYLAPGCRLVVTVPGGPMSAFDRHIGHRQHFTPSPCGRWSRKPASTSSTPTRPDSRSSTSTGSPSSFADSDSSTTWLRAPAPHPREP